MLLHIHVVARFPLSRPLLYVVVALCWPESHNCVAWVWCCWLVGWLLVLARYFPKCQLVELFVSSLIGKINELNLIALKHIIYCLFRLSVWPMGVPSSFNPSAHLEMAHYSIGWNNTGVFAIGCFTIKYYC